MLHTSQLIHTALITLFYVINVQIIKLPIMHFYVSLVTSLALRLNILITPTSLSLC